MSTDPAWQPLFVLRARFEANLEALAGRDAALAERFRRQRPSGEYFVAARSDSVIIGRRTNDSAIETTPSRLSPAGARQVVAKLCPNGTVTDSILVAGVDQGWLWGMLYELPVSSPARPGSCASTKRWNALSSSAPKPASTFLVVP